MQDGASQTRIDGISPPSPPQPEGCTTSPSPALVRRSYVALAVFALLYIIPAVMLLSLFPRADGRFLALHAFGMGAYAVGALALLTAALVAVSRITSKKDRHPRLKLIALVRLAGYIAPLILLSVGVLLRLSLPPRLGLEVLTPPSSTEIIAPIEVTFGLPTALQYFRSKGLSPLKYEWDFNGDSTIDQESFDPQGTYIFSKSGIFAVTCRVTMSSGESKILAYRLVVPRAGIGVLPTSPTIDDPAVFSVEHFFLGADAKSPKLVQAQWDFDGDGVIDQETASPTASFTYHRLGTIVASVTLTLSNQTQTTLTRTLQVVPQPEQPFSISLETEPPTLLGPPPFGVLFSLKTSESIASALWDFGNRKSAEGLRVAQVFPTEGTYTVTATVRSDSGAVARITKVVRVTSALQIPDLTFEGVPPVRSFSAEGRVPLTIDLAPVTALPLVSFSWDVASAEGIEASGKQLRGIIRDPGSYSADLIGIDADQRVFRRRLRIVASPPDSLVTFSMNPEAPTAPAIVRFDASDVFIPGEGITGFEWDFGDASSDSLFTGARTEHRYETPGSYVVVLTVRTTSGKSFQAKKTLVVRAPLLDACFLPSRRSGTAPLGVTFDPTCSTGDFSQWLWDFGDGSQSDEKLPTHVFVEPGTYLVSLTARTPSGATSTLSSTITISKP